MAFKSLRFRRSWLVAKVALLLLAPMWESFKALKKLDVRADPLSFSDGFTWPRPRGRNADVPA